MIIGKLFEFENAHIVRNCSSKRCKTSIHGHSYKLLLCLSAKRLDNAGMVYDFGLLKKEIKQIIDAFDHSICLWENDDIDYINDIKKHSLRWISLPCNISAENLSIIFYALIYKILQNTKTQNNEDMIKINSIRLNETRTGFAQCEFDDVFDENGKCVYDLNKIKFSDEINQENDNLLIKILNKYTFINPKEV